MKKSFKIVLPLAVVAVALALAGAMVVLRPVAESGSGAPPAPLVRVIAVAPEAVAVRVAAQGTVEPRTESDLVAEVTGRIIEVSPQLASGGFFASGEVLVRIDPRDYEVSLEAANAALARAQSQHRLDSADLGRERTLRSRGASSRAKLERSVHAEAVAAASVREARVSVERASLDLERSVVRAPFAGRVRTKHVDVGQFVTRGTPVARLYAVDYAEIRLAIPDEDLAHLALPLRANATAPPADVDAEASRPDTAPTRSGPGVILRARFAGRERTWTGHIVRVEGALDAETRMVTLVARVDDPYGLLLPESERTNEPPLAIGLFVEAEIEGRTLEGLYPIPRAALRGRSEVVVVDAEQRLRPRTVEIVHADRDRVWVGGGLEAGEQVCVSPLGVVVEGMKVRLEPRRTDASKHRADAPSTATSS